MTDANRFPTLTVMPLPLEMSGGFRDSEDGAEGEGDSSLDTVQRVETPRLYRVLLLNDDFTPMDFVVHVLQKFFKKTQDEATVIMLDVHKKGAGTAGVFALEIAEMKVMQVNQFARMSKYPLKCTLEPT